MNEAIRQTIERYQKHLQVIEGPASVERFSESPYFIENGGRQFWEWNEHQLRLDQAALAKTCVGSAGELRAIANHLESLKQKDCPHNHKTTGYTGFGEHETQCLDCGAMVD